MVFVRRSQAYKVRCESKNDIMGYKHTTVPAEAPVDTFYNQQLWLML
jgi:hypothetical protein